MTRLIVQFEGEVSPVMHPHCPSRGLTKTRNGQQTEYQSILFILSSNSYNLILIKVIQNYSLDIPRHASHDIPSSLKWFKHNFNTKVFRVCFFLSFISQVRDLLFNVD